MADTVITPAYDRNESGAGGWAVAVIVLLGVIAFGLFVWPGIVRTPAGNASTPTNPDTIDVNVQLPQGIQGSGSQQGTNPEGGAAPTSAQ